ncbi:conserved hypothetical protein [Candidatus Desulfarcum epimagneticum]|uniref:Macro domain-containing protein n=1 Tax=uncultured Desulfobacteraceae bacterium TaxID=218296 RepID=A0A484HJR5_9BACT|nr:conserved hypothetical protein [uncultured Desulfobacteraceae bacterium]
MEPIQFGKLEARLGDITRMDVDAIVNAANSSLLGGGGVDGAIHRAAGPGLLEECRTLGGCPTGEARITGGHNLKARHVIHTVGPVYSGVPEDARLLALCYKNSLGLALEHGLSGVAFPAVSCGVYGYPLEEACRIATGVTWDFLEKEEGIKRAVFVLFSEENFKIYQNRLEKMARSRP